MGSSSRDTGVGSADTDEPSEPTRWRPQIGGSKTRLSRAQSEVIGIVLLVAVIVVLLTVVGAIVIGEWQSEADDETPRIAVDSDLEATELVIRHQGGDSLPAEDVQVLLEGDTNQAFALAGFDDTAGDRFEPGSVWRQQFDEDPLDGVIDVFVVHRSTGTVLHEATHEVTAPVSVSITGVQDTVDVGETVTIDYELTNYRVDETSTDVELAIDEEVQDTQTIDIGAGETMSDQFTYETDQSDASGITVRVSTPDSQDSVTVAVVAPSFFEIVDLDTPDEVTEGDTVDVSYTIENTGTESATQSITFTVDGETITTHDDVTLDGGETHSDAFTYQTTADDPPEITTEVTSEDQSSSAVVTVAEGTPGGSDLLAILEDAEPVFEGDTFETHLTYRNPSDADETVTLVTYGDGTVPDRTTIRIEPGEETTPEALGFPEEGTITSIEDDPDEPEVQVEIGES